MPETDVRNKRKMAEDVCVAAIFRYYYNLAMQDIYINYLLC